MGTEDYKSSGRRKEVLPTKSSKIPQNNFYNRKIRLFELGESLKIQKERYYNKIRMLYIYIWRVLECVRKALSSMPRELTM